MTIPLQSEIQSYLKEKKPDWPDKFCAWYSEKIWLFYDQKGWMIGRNKMQRWKSAISLHFLELNEQAQMELNKFKVIHISGKPLDDLGEIEAIYQKYIHHPTMVPESILSPLYDLMKEMGIMKLSKEQCQICLKMGPERGKAQAVKFAFENRALNKRII